MPLNFPSNFAFKTAADIYIRNKDNFFTVGQNNFGNKIPFHSFNKIWEFFI